MAAVNYMARVGLLPPTPGLDLRPHTGNELLQHPTEFGDVDDANYGAQFVDNYLLLRRRRHN
jgi:hypothetical protein